MLGTTGYDPGYPYDVYDSLDGLEPKEDYDKGYVICIFATISDVQSINIVNFLHRTNPYAYIPTEYVLLDTGFPGAVCYAIYKTRFEYICAQVAIRYDDLQVKTSILYEIMSNKKVYFHKHWLLDSYDPNKFTDEYKYKVACHSIPVKKMIGKKEFLRLRRKQHKKKQCYIPVSKEDDTCNMKNLRNKQICARCGVSRYAGRYDISGKCIHRVNRKRTCQDQKKEIQ